MLNVIKNEESKSKIDSKKSAEDILYEKLKHDKNKHAYASTKLCDLSKYINKLSIFKNDTNTFNMFAYSLRDRFYLDVDNSNLNEECKSFLKNALNARFLKIISKNNIEIKKL